jgi:hypothetical protein
MERRKKFALRAAEHLTILIDYEEREEHDKT